MPTIIATPKATDANSYITVADADTFFDGRLYSTLWTVANDTNKQRALIWATRLLDRMMVWHGYPTTRDQALRWPRSGGYDADGNSLDADTIPVLLEEGVCELALYLLEKDAFKPPALFGQGIKSAKVGPLSVTVDTESGEQEVIPSNIVSLLNDLGTLEQAASKGSTVVLLSRA